MPVRRVIVRTPLRRGLHVRRWLTRPGLVVLLLIGAVAVVTSGSHAANRHEATYSYGVQARQGIDAYWYDTATPRPALLLLHGGYYDSGSKSDWVSSARYFADHGFAVFSADYRYDTDAAWPAPRDDAIAAADWIKAHAGRFDADPARLAVLGSQAGGQLATALATYGAGRTRIDAAVGLSPISSPYRAWVQAPTGSATAAQRKIRDETVVLNRCYPNRADTACWHRWTDSIAKDHASGADDAPMYLIHSTGDAIPPVQSTDLRDAELAKGMNPADITVQTLGGNGSGGPLLTTAVRSGSSPGSSPVPTAPRRRARGYPAARRGRRPRRPSTATTTSRCPPRPMRCVPSPASPSPSAPIRTAPTRSRSSTPTTRPRPPSSPRS